MPNECQEKEACFEWGSVAKVSVEKYGEFCYDFKWTTKNLQNFKDCFFLRESDHWFGGPEEYYQRFPINKKAKRNSVPYLPGDMLQDKDKYFGGVAEPYFLTSKGVGRYSFLYLLVQYALFNLLIFPPVIDKSKLYKFFAT